MRPFLSENFLLKTKTAERLYFEFAKEMPILDYHNHLPPQEIAENKVFENLTQIWLKGDHYKWRAMRALGIQEHFITGTATDLEKYMAWVATVPHTLRNPLYHWTHLELKNPFGITDLLDKKSAKAIYENCNQQLQEKWSVQNILHHFKVKALCTTDDPTDSLEFHSSPLNPQKGDLKNCLTQRGESGWGQAPPLGVGGLSMFPTFRPDKAMSPENITDYNAYLDKLSAVSGVEVQSWDTFLKAIQNRHDFFASKGCKLSDHGLETLYAEPYTEAEIKQIFLKIRKHQTLLEKEILQFKSACLYEFAKMDFEKGWVQQFHLGAIRNTNTHLLKKLGADAGVDSIGDFSMARAMAAFFDRLAREEKLTKTILYNLNPADNELFATMIGNYQEKTMGKMQFGAAWWFLDQKEGMERQINALSNMGLLSLFVGMLTDSRSFLSFSRHEYFRRILCNIFGNDIENGEIPNDLAWVGEIIQNICYYNAERYFDLNYSHLPKKDDTNRL